MNSNSRFNDAARTMFGQTVGDVVTLQFPMVTLETGFTPLTVDDCGKCFTDEGHTSWTWLELPNAVDCLGKPGIMFKFARPLGGDRGAPCLTVYPKWEAEGDDGPLGINIAIDAEQDLDAVSPCNDGHMVWLTAQICNEVRFNIGSYQLSDPTPGQLVTGLTSGATGYLRYADRYTLILVGVSGSFQGEETITFDSAAPELITSNPLSITARWRDTIYKGAFDDRND